MKRFAILMLALCCSMTLFARNNVPKGWTTDIDAALSQARKEKKQVLVLFTGSDWCSYCVRLKKDILDKKQFKKVVPSKFVLVYFDFPYKNKKISDNQKKVQDLWANRLGVDGFPTTVILDRNGRKIKTISGYSNPKLYLEELFPELKRR